MRLARTCQVAVSVALLTAGGAGAGAPQQVDALGRACAAGDAKACRQLADIVEDSKDPAMRRAARALRRAAILLPPHDCPDVCERECSG